MFFEKKKITDLLNDHSNKINDNSNFLWLILILGIWYQEFLILASLLMAFLMLGAQYYHIKVKNPIMKFIPSFVLLILCLFIAAFNHGLL